MQVSRWFENVSGIAQRTSALFKVPEGGVSPDTTPDAGRREERADNRERTRRQSERKKKLRSQIRSKKRQLKRIRMGIDDTEKSAAGIIEHKRIKKIAQQEIFELERELLAANERRPEGEPVTGALPDFAIIGAAKGGTSFFYHLLTLHPYVEPAAAKELHFFDALFEEGVDWYRQFFPVPRWENGRRTITGEATPYLGDRRAPERMAGVVPHARLIALLRNPVDRTYSWYHHQVRRGLETRTFEEAIEAEEARLRGKREKLLENEHYDSFEHQRFWYLTLSVYVDQLLRWSEFFDREQMLVLKSEDLYEDPGGTLRAAYGFLGLPQWEPEASEILLKKRNKGSYERDMDLATRERLEEYFEPHNRRLYDFLGVDFGW